MQNKTKIIGISGTNGSGKDTVSLLISELLNFQFVSLGQMLRDELKKQGKSLTRDSTRELSNQLETTNGPDVLVQMALEKFDPTKFNGIVISSLRNVFEADKIKELGGLILWIDADPQIRWQRVQKRDNNRPDDRASFSNFILAENNEMNPSPTNHNLNVMAVKPKANHEIFNNGDLLSLKSSLTEYFSVESN